MMNLPSIFKASDMKGQQKGNSNNPIPPQDTFGLGIQVFKISSKKQTGSDSSAGKARQNMRNLENPVKKTPVQIPKPKKISSVLPEIRPQKIHNMSPAVRTGSIVSKRKVEKTQHSMSKIESIREIGARRPVYDSQASKNPPAGKVTKHLNKTADIVVPLSKTTPETEWMLKRQWRSQLNLLVNFYQQSDRFKKQQESKAGKKKNQQYLEEESDFMSAYIAGESPFYDQPRQYQPFGIENYKQGGFNHLNYEEYRVQ